MKVTRDRPKRMVHLSQQAYVEKMVKNYGLRGNKTPKTPGLDIISKFGINQTGIPLTPEDAELYRALVGSLLYAANVTRIDICFAVTLLCRYTSISCQHHLEAAFRVLAYLNNTADWSLVFGRSSGNSDTSLVCYTDSDWAGAHDTRKSTSGGIVIFNGDVVKWFSKKQKSVSLSNHRS